MNSNAALDNDTLKKYQRGAKNYYTGLGPVGGYQLTQEMLNEILNEALDETDQNGNIDFETLTKKMV